MSRGRREDRWAFWRKLVTDQRASGLSVPAFCRERGVSDASFYSWRRRLAADTSVRSESVPAQFVPVSIASAESAIEIRIPNGLVVTAARGFDEAELLRLLRVATSWEPSDA